MLKKGFAKKVDNSHANETNVWYIPHHAVYHPTKKKIRVVFNCAANFSEHCLNEELLQGPDLANLLVGVLMRFRKEEVAVQADIASMFYQVLVPDEQQKFLRFVYWPDGDLTKGLQDYQMCAHLFGAKSSTSCCIYALRRAALDNKDNYSQDVCEIVLDNFYIDDLLKSFPSIEIAISQMSEVTALCNEAGFNLSKFVSNSEEVIQSIPNEKRAIDDNEKSIGEGDYTGRIERALGALWNIENDSLCFKITMNDTPLSRTGMLSTISSVFDPCGLAGPFLLPGRKVMQLVVRDKKGWDADVADEHSSAWKRWRLELMNLNNISINRCFKPKGFGESTHSSLHCFSDASEVGYGQATYLRQENKAGEVAVSLVMGKSRVAPLKVTTIPRLELVAAKVSVKVAALVKEEMKIENLQDIYHTDSEIVLGQLSNTDKRFRTFVANRVQTIRTYTSISQWRHVSSGDNPADLASRGFSANEEGKLCMWIHGPEKLTCSRDVLDKVDLPAIEINENDPEVVKKVCVLGTKLKDGLIDNISLIGRMELRISRWIRMVRVLLQIMKFISKCRKKSVSNKISTEEFDNGENTLIKLIQVRDYPEEIHVYKNAKSSNKKKV